MGRSARRWVRILGLATIAAGLLWAGWQIGRAQRDRKAMAAIRADIRDGRNATAASKLQEYLAARPGSDEALYLLGACDMALGRSAAADASWAKVPPDSSFAARAILGRMQIELGRGRAAEAERLVQDAMRDPRIDAAGLPILLGPILSQQGRLEEALQVIEARWNRLEETGQGATEPAIQLVRLHIELRRQPIPVDAARTVLEQAASLTPDDDRVWLGRANLAVRAGAYDEAGRLLEDCLRRRPEDIPVWRTRLDWAVASGRVAEALKAMEHLPAAGEPPARVRRLGAWLAVRRGDPAAERRALEQLVAVDPSDGPAVDRLIDLETRQGRPDRASDLRRHKARIVRLQARYEALHRRNQPRRDADEMSRLAEQLGQPFEARAFAAIAAAADPDDEELHRRLVRLTPAGRTITAGGPTLADVLAADGTAPAAAIIP